jgi:tubby-related protein 1
MYQNDLFTDGDVLGGPSQADKEKTPVSPTLAARPGTAQKLQQQQSQAAARRAQRIGQSNGFERNETLSRGLTSPNGAHASQSSFKSDLDPAKLSGTSGILGGLPTTYDPLEAFNSEEKDENGNGVGRRQQPQSSPVAAAPPPIRLDLTDLNTFLKQPGPKAGPVQCYIVRDKGSAKMYPKYNLFLEDGKKFLLAARKRKKQTTSNYLISLDYEDLGRDSDKFFGKLRSNFVGTDFTVFDNGDKTGGKRVSADGAGHPRQELGCVTYGYNVLGTRGPRKMTACIPRVDASGNPMFVPDSESDTIIDR